MLLFATYTSRGRFIGQEIEEDRGTIYFLIRKKLSLLGIENLHNDIACNEDHDSNVQRELLLERERERESLRVFLADCIDKFL